MKARKIKSRTQCIFVLPKDYREVFSDEQLRYGDLRFYLNGKTFEQSSDDVFGWAGITPNRVKERYPYEKWRFARKIA